MPLKICWNILAVVDRRLADQLPEGKFWESSDELRGRVMLLPQHQWRKNMSMVDSLCRRCDKMTFDKMEARVKVIRLALSRTEKWSRSGNVCCSFTTRGKKAAWEWGWIQERLSGWVEAARTELEQKEENARNVTEKLVEDILDIGLWCSSVAPSPHIKLFFRQKYASKCVIWGLRFQYFPGGGGHAPGRTHLEHIRGRLCQLWWE